TDWAYHLAVVAWGVSSEQVEASVPAPKDGAHAGVLHGDVCVETAAAEPELSEVARANHHWTRVDFAVAAFPAVVGAVYWPVLLDGNVIHLSQITLGVTEACSGIRSLISLLAVAVAWAALTLPGTWAMVGLVASVVPITVLANAGRVVSTGLIGQWFGIEYAQGFYHTFSGWINFLLAFAGLFGVHSMIRLAQARQR